MKCKCQSEEHDHTKDECKKDAMEGREVCQDCWDGVPQADEGGISQPK
jgi:hypothetical protein